MNEREQFERQQSYHKEDFKPFCAGLKAGAESKQAELDKANARIAQLEECLEEIRKLGGFHKAKVMAVAALTESPTTWLSEHDKAVERKDKTT